MVRGIVVVGTVVKAWINEFDSKKGHQVEMRVDVDCGKAGKISLSRPDDKQTVLPEEGDVLECAISRVLTKHGDWGGFTLFVCEDWSHLGRMELVASNGRANA